MTTILEAIPALAYIMILVVFPIIGIALSIGGRSRDE